MTRRGGEVVFNTSLTGYQEVFTDPSYAGQIVCLTYPHIGNVGTNLDDEESPVPHIESLVVREFSAISSNWRSERIRSGLSDAAQYSRGLGRGYPRAGAAHPQGGRSARRGGHRRDTRGTLDCRSAIFAVDGGSGTGQPRHRRQSNMPGTGAPLNSRHRRGTKPWVKSQSSGESRRFRVVAYDFGIKQNILRLLVDHNCDVTVVPAQTSAEDAMALKPDGVFLSNGPGDPEPATYAIETIRNLLGRVPVFGICLGHQLCGLALGGKTFKLRFGHHGSNHPVKNLLTGQVEITAQNHGFCVDPDSLPAERCRNHAFEFERPDQRRFAPPQPAAIFRAVPSRGFARAARFALFVPAVH